MFPHQVIRADDLGRVMVDVAVNETGESQNLVLENREILAMVKSLHPSAVQGYSRTNQPRT
jgi:hypothetical protein